MKITVRDIAGNYMRSAIFELDAENDNEVNLYWKYVKLIFGLENKFEPTDSRGNNKKMTNPCFDTEKLANELDKRLGDTARNAMK